jgi:hypothetical protein
MWRVVGSPPIKEPSFWARLPTAADFIRSLAASLKVGNTQLWKAEQAVPFVVEMW